MTQLPFNPRTMTAKNALAALADHPDLTVAQLADLLAEEGRHVSPRVSVRRELNARIEAAAPLDDEPEEDLADEPDEEDESTEASSEAETGDEVLGPAAPLEFGDDVTITFSNSTVHEARFKRYVTGIEVVLRDQRETLVVSLDGDWMLTPKLPVPGDDDEGK
tara:strand:- start:81 stop:569 length:489 start_codon:yes stop_codon:yes gene_type:complete